MDKGEHRASLARQAETELLEKQRAHIESFEELEKQGLDLDVITDIFGVGILRSDMHENRVVLDLLRKLYGAFNGDNKHAAILCTVDQMVPGCHGFGGPVEYERKTILRIYTGILNHDQIKCMPRDSGEAGSPEVVIEAPSATIYPSGERKDSFAPSALLSVRSEFDLKVPAWLDGGFIDWQDGSQIQIFGATDVGALFKETDAYIRTRSSDTRGVGFGFYDAFNDWIREQNRDTSGAE